MNPLFTEEEYNNAKYKDKLPLKCEICGKIYLSKKSVIRQARIGRRVGKYCSRKCIGESRKVRENLKCKNCNKEFERCPSLINDANNFCEQRCAATYNNTHKAHGTRRSKLEVWLEAKLPLLFPNLEFHFNRKDAINSELDIYIPELKLAFELNGIFHYEPIFGQKKLAQIENNDERKFQACLENDIELCIIDVSSFSYFKEKGAMKYLDIIRNIIEVVSHNLDSN